MALIATATALFVFLVIVQLTGVDGVARIALSIGVAILVGAVLRAMRFGRNRH